MQISNEGLTRMTLGQLLELGLHSKELLNRLKFSLLIQGVGHCQCIVKNLVSMFQSRSVSISSIFGLGCSFLVFCNTFFVFFFLNEQVFVVSLESKVLQHVAEISQNIHSLGESTYIRNLKQSQLSAVSTT